MMQEFRAEPFYERITDSLIYYARDERSYAKYIDKYLTIFLSVNDDTFVGFEITGLYAFLARSNHDTRNN